MFNLEQAIAEWRGQMRAAGIATPVPLDELESHLREDIEHRLRSNVTPEQAFALAVQRLGDAGNLSREFKKARRRNVLRALSVLAGAAFAYSVIFITWIIERRAGKIEITRTEFLLVLGSLAATILFGFMGRYFARFLPIVTDERLQAALIVTVIFLGACLFRLVWSFLNLDSLVHAQIVLLWTMSPWLGFGYCCSAWCEKCAAARRQARAANA